MISIIKSGPARFSFHTRKKRVHGFSDFVLGGYNFSSGTCTACFGDIKIFGTDPCLGTAGFRLPGIYYSYLRVSAGF